MIPKTFDGFRPRVCAVSFLNTVPLVWGMLHGDQRGLFDLEFRIPSECADRMRAGAADIGILPSIELDRQKLEIIPGAGIACHGPVRSILLISKLEPSRIKTLATDTSSRTSVQLARIILSEKYGVRPALVPMRPDMESMLASADAALIIGDPALRIDPAALPYKVLDLGGEWTRMTGLPMVFAAWGCRKELVTEELTKAFADSCRFGITHIGEIARREAASRGITETLARDYLTRNIVLELGPRDYEGLKLFLEHARTFDNLVSSGTIA